MLILSQDGRKLINMFNVDKIYLCEELYEDSDDIIDILVYFKGNVESIGTYQTKEKALSVLDDIMLEYQHVESYRMPEDKKV